MSYNTTIEKTYDMLNNTNTEMYIIWLRYVLYTWQWWLQVALTVTPWILWVMFRKKQSSCRLLFSGLFVIIVSYFLDIVGIAMGLWQYRWEVIPITPSIAPWDMSLIPVAVMFTLQYNPFKLNRYVKAVIFSAGASFIDEPLFAHYGFYILIKWRYIYSFPITAIMYLVADWLSRCENFESIN